MLPVWKKLLLGLRFFPHHRTGWCPVCGRYTMFICSDPTIPRNNFHCLFCRSKSLERHLAKVFLGQVTESSAESLSGYSLEHDTAIYNLDHGDSISKHLRALENLVCSELFEDKEPGTEVRENLYCQNVENLTFDDERFDVVFSCDVFEHVRDDDAGFREIYRVLKPGGVHVFTVPFGFRREIHEYVDTSGKEDQYVKEPTYHYDSSGERHLVYRTYGFELLSRLEEIGFSTTSFLSSYKDQREGIFDSWVFVSEKEI